MSGFGLGFGFAYVRSILSRAPATEIFTANTINANGTSEFVEIADNTKLNWGTSTVMLSGWVIGGQQMSLFDKTQESVNDGITALIALADGTIVFDLAVTTTNRRQWASPIASVPTDGLLHHVVVYHARINDADAPIAYVDGVSVGALGIGYTAGSGWASHNFQTVGKARIGKQVLSGIAYSKIASFVGLALDYTPTQADVDQLFKGGTPQCFDLLSTQAPTLASGFNAFWELANWAGHTGLEVTDATGNLNSFEPTAIPFTGTAQIECEEYVPSVNDMLMTIDTTQAGSASDTFIFPLTSMGGLASIQIAWGDGSSSVITAVGQAELTHVYAVGGVKTLTVIGTSGYQFRFNNLGDKDKLITLDNCGNLLLTSGIFQGCSNLTDVLATDQPVSYDSLLNNAFANCPSLNGSAWFEGLLFTGVTGLDRFLNSATVFDADISAWPVSNINDMDFMLLNTALSVTNYDNFLIAMALSPPVTATNLGAGGVFRSNASLSAYTTLTTAPISMTITDAGIAP